MAKSEIASQKPNLLFITNLLENLLHEPSFAGGNEEIMKVMCCGCDQEWPTQTGSAPQEDRLLTASTSLDFRTRWIPVTQAFGINNRSQIVGDFSDDLGLHVFIFGFGT